MATSTPTPTIFPPPGVTSVRECTLALCPLTYATVHYDPTLVGNSLYLCLFAVILLIQAGQCIKYRTYSFTFAMISGLVLEIVGYLGRVQMHFNPFLSNPFLLYIICLTIGPVFFSAALYLTLSRIILRYGPTHSRFSPKTISLTFMTSDFIALVLQALGGALADTATTRNGEQMGTHIMVAGLSFQVFCLLVFIVLCVEFAWNVRRERGVAKSWGSERGFKAFLWSLSFATLCILIRSCFRVAELAKGFNSPLANEQIPFMILEGAMISCATLAMTIFHPGRAFGEKWEESGWSFRTKEVGGDVESSGS
jgi:hypothetical protein